MRVLIADKLPGEIRGALTNLGFEIIYEPDAGADELPEKISGVHVLVVRSTRVVAAAIDAGDKLQLIVRAGAGTNTIDVTHAAEHGVYVANCPGKNALAVAELTMGLILSLDRQIPDNVIALREGRWDKARFGKGRGLYGRTLGVLGYGRIGAAVAARARAFGMHIVAWDLRTDLGDGVERCDTVREVCARADVVTVHVPRTDDTFHIVGEPELDAMRQGALLVHTSRGGVVDDAALAKAVAAGRIRAACDVHEDEPAGGKGPWESRFRTLEGFYGTHHIGASTAQAQEAVGAEVVRILETFKSEGRVLNAINVWDRPQAAGQLLVRHVDRVGVLAGVLDALRDAELNVQDMQNTIFQGGRAAVAKVTLSQAPEAALLERLVSGGDDVLSLEWVPFADPR